MNEKLFCDENHVIFIYDSAQTAIFLLILSNFLVLCGQNAKCQLATRSENLVPRVLKFLLHWQPAAGSCNFDPCYIWKVNGTITYT